MQRLIKTKLNVRRVSRRGQLLLIALGTLGAWGGFLLLTFLLPPTGSLTVFGAFFLLGLAFSGICVLLAYWILWLLLSRRGQHPPLTRALREGGLISTWLLFNLVLSTLHSWSLFTTLISLGIIIVIELLILGNK